MLFRTLFTTLTLAATAAVATAVTAPTLQQQQPAEGVAGEIAARARKSLRRDVESKLAESSRRFLTAFAEVDKVRLT